MYKTPQHDAVAQCNTTQKHTKKEEEEEEAEWWSECRGVSGRCETQALAFGTSHKTLPKMITSKTSSRSHCPPFVAVAAHARGGFDVIVFGLPLSSMFGGLRRPATWTVVAISESSGGMREKREKERGRRRRKDDGKGDSFILSFFEIGFRVRARGGLGLWASGDRP